MDIRLIFFLFVLLVGWSISAQASHYVLSSVDVVEEAMIEPLAKAGILTTEDLWNKTTTKKKRQTLAKKLGTTPLKLQDWHDFCDLLRLPGVGPKVARVMQLSGVQHLSKLAREDPESLIERLTNTNNQYKILGKMPEDESIRTWVETARQLVRKK